jgi:hypothetical protein
MGICPHCMQQKPYTASKCPQFHERVGFLESVFVDWLHKGMQLVLFVLFFYMLSKCVGS